MSKIYSIGELLIDFQSVGVAPLKDTQQFVKKAGGAPANVCVQAVKLGQQAVYLTQVGADGFGQFLIDTLKEEGVDTTFIKQTAQYDTSLAFVSFMEGGEREFSFFRKAAADLYFTAEDFKGVTFEKGDILEYGSVALQTQVAQDTHRYLIEKAKQAGATICFDPNLRFNLWQDKEELRAVVQDFYSYADVMKIGEDELEFVTGKTGEQAVNEVFGSGLKVLLLTKGSKGADVYLADGTTYHCDGYRVKTVDTTAAGDSCFGSFLAQILERGLTTEALMDKSVDYSNMLSFSCKCGAYTTMSFGAISAMGTKEIIEEMVK